MRKEAARGDQIMKLMRKARDFAPAYSSNNSESLMQVMKQRLATVGAKPPINAWDTSDFASALALNTASSPRPADATSVGLIKMLRDEMKNRPLKARKYEMPYSDVK